MKKPSSYQKLKAENTALKCRVERLERELAKVNDRLERVCDLLLEKNGGSDTQKFLYHKGDDNNSVGKLVSIGSKREWWSR
ncbi:uncharacterized protein HPF209_1344 [Helicobacter pylori]|uniref:hypothetical protein n=1 Tax=Helicobacter pylori TaxID=210 RepID=UPI00095833A5|nr:hypothetical protein [Helicobacter pylori]BAW41629.1 uncharacterized protein HPF209_1344 [Helicobacter pylori]